MSNKIPYSWMMLVAVFCIATPPQGAQTPTRLSAAQIADRNVAARGGLEKWRSVQSLSMAGKLQGGGNSRPALPMPTRSDGHSMPPARPAAQVLLPFVMEQRRPRKMRVEIEFNGQTAIQVFDGTRGWKLRPFLNRRQVEPYTQDEMKAVATQAELDGPLVDYAAKGTKVELAGSENVEGRDTYKLKLTLSNGVQTNLWIDATTFLETKIEGSPRILDGKLHPVEIYYRDFRTVSGLQIPFVLETTVLNPQAVGMMPRATATEQILIEKVEVNAPLNDALFSRADLESAASNVSAAIHNPTMP
jgi:hypothetical protein